MKILQINTKYKSGSTGRIVYDISNILLSNNYESYVAFGRLSDNEFNKKYEFYFGNKIITLLNVFFNRIFDIEAYFSKLNTKKLIKHISKVNPDLIHVHNLHGYYLDLKILINFFVKYNKPLVMTLHDCWTFTGHCAYFDFVGCSKWEKQCQKCPQKTSYPKSIFFDNSKLNFNNKKQLFTTLKKLHIITPSEWLSVLIRRSFLKQFPTSIINNGIDLSVFKFSKKIAKYNNVDFNNKFIILGIANQWSNRKGLNYFIELAKKLNEQYIIIMIGIDKKLAKTLPKNILAISRTENLSQLVDFYSTAHVLLNPTLEDNFPTVNIEAIACGTPVITFNTGGSVEIIDDKTGIVCKNKDIDSIIEAIKKIQYIGKDYFTENCRNRALLMYDKNKQFSLYVDTYKKILNQEFSKQ